jgi:hypothetical protein
MARPQPANARPSVLVSIIGLLVIALAVALSFLMSQIQHGYNKRQHNRLSVCLLRSHPPRQGSAPLRLLHLNMEPILWPTRPVSPLGR